MNRKALLVLIPLFSMLSLLVMPAFASAYSSVEASGWASVKTYEGCVSGCATLYVVFGGVELGAVPALSDSVVGDFVVLVVQDHAFEWIIDLSSVKCKCNVLTFCAYPQVSVEATVTTNTVPVLSTPLSPISVVVDLCKPYCVTAFGCSAFFTGQGHPLD
jgi:hypothetical protein